jgi:hypothetical protein
MFFKGKTAGTPSPLPLQTFWKKFDKNCIKIALSRDFTLKFLRRFFQKADGGSGAKPLKKISYGVMI